MSPEEERDRFLRRFGHVAEGSPWVAEAAWERGPFADRGAVIDAFGHAVREAGPARRLSLIRAHPDLAGRAALAGDLTRESAAEQASAGLDRLTPEDLDHVTRLSTAYRSRFGFPFVICVRGRSVTEILAVWERRLGNDEPDERAAAIEEIVAIIALRVEAAP